VLGRLAELWIGLRVDRIIISCFFSNPAAHLPIDAEAGQECSDERPLSGPRNTSGCSGTAPTGDTGGRSVSEGAGNAMVDRRLHDERANDRSGEEDPCRSRANAGYGTVPA